MSDPIRIAEARTHRWVRFVNFTQPHDANWPGIKPGDPRYLVSTVGHTSLVAYSPDASVYTVPSDSMVTVMAMVALSSIPAGNVVLWYDGQLGIVTEMKDAEENIGVQSGRTLFYNPAIEFFDLGPSA